MVLLLLHIFLQIIFEMLPLSSSGHVKLLFTLLCGQQAAFRQLENYDAIGLLLHVPAVVVIGCYFFKVWFNYLCRFVKLDKQILKLFMFCVVADAITTGFYFLFGVVGTDFFLLWFGFLLTGFALLSLQNVTDCIDEKKYSLKNGAVLGTVQGLALLPGISRFGSTFVAARWLGFASADAFELSFLIGWPLMVAGSLKGIVQVYRAGQMGQLLQLPVLLSILIATVVSWFVLCWVAQLIERNELHNCSWWLWFMAALAFFIC